MSIREIIITDEPILHQRAKKVHHFDPSLQRLVDDMFETMHDVGGAGLAAPQIAQSLRIFVAQYAEHKVAIFNPEIVKADGESLGNEACLSTPGVEGKQIRRAARILVKGQDVRGKQIRVAADGWLARIIQHEIDHLDGIVYADHLDSPDDLHIMGPDDFADEHLTIG
jgi:peptide deformylase